MIRVSRFVILITLILAVVFFVHDSSNSNIILLRDTNTYQAHSHGNLNDCVAALLDTHQDRYLWCVTRQGGRALPAGSDVSSCTRIVRSQRECQQLTLLSQAHSNLTLCTPDSTYCSTFAHDGILDFGPRDRLEWTAFVGFEMGAYEARWTNASTLCTKLLFKASANATDNERRVLLPEIDKYCPTGTMHRDLHSGRGGKAQAWSPCTWMASPRRCPPATLADVRENRLPRLLQILHRFSKSGLLFYPLDGTALGAFRHGGAIPGDGDMDFCIPIHLNFPLLRPGVEPCDDAKQLPFPRIRVSEPLNKKTRSFWDSKEHSKATLCGWTVAQYAERVREVLALDETLQTIFKAEFNNTWQRGGRLRMANLPAGVRPVQLDIYISLFDFQIFSHPPEDPGTPSLCQCTFSNFSGALLCYEDPMLHLATNYGVDFMTPNRNLSPPCV